MTLCINLKLLDAMNKNASNFITGSAYPGILQATRVPPQPQPTGDPTAPPAPTVPPTEAPSCGKRVFITRKREQELTSPNFPQNYPNNMRCSWQIKTKRPAEISFPNFSTEREHDRITLYLDGSIVGRFSGSMTSRPFRFSQIAVITFTSDRSQSSTGFRAVFKTGL